MAARKRKTHLSKPKPPYGAGKWEAEKMGVGTIIPVLIISWIANWIGK